MTFFHVNLRTIAAAVNYEKLSLNVTKLSRKCNDSATHWHVLWLLEHSKTLPSQVDGLEKIDQHGKLHQFCGLQFLLLHSM